MDTKTYPVITPEQWAEFASHAGRLGIPDGTVMGELRDLVWLRYERQTWGRGTGA